jgi:hypothetical protein
MRKYNSLITGNWDGCDCEFSQSGKATENLSLVLVIRFIYLFMYFPAKELGF